MGSDAYEKSGFMDILVIEPNWMVVLSQDYRRCMLMVATWMTIAPLLLG